MSRIETENFFRSECSGSSCLPILVPGHERSGKLVKPLLKPKERNGTDEWIKQQSFVAVSSVLEGVGTSAYLGAAALIANKDYLTAAGGILTVEARHSAYIRASLKESPFPQPFDDPLTPNEVYSLAAPFIVSCPPSNPPLPVKAYPRHALATTGPIKSGDTIVLSTPGYVLSPPSGSGASLYAAFITLTGPLFVEAAKVSNGYDVVVPNGINGQSYVVLTSCNETVSDATIAAGPAIVEVTN